MLDDNELCMQHSRNLVDLISRHACQKREPLNDSEAIKPGLAKHIMHHGQTLHVIGCLIVRCLRQDLYSQVKCCIQENKLHI